MLVYVWSSLFLSLIFPEFQNSGDVLSFRYSVPKYKVGDIVYISQVGMKVVGEITGIENGAIYYQEIQTEYLQLSLITRKFRIGPIQITVPSAVKFKYDVLKYDNNYYRLYAKK